MTTQEQQTTCAQTGSSPAEFIQPGVLQLTQSVKMSATFTKVAGALARAQGKFGKVLKDLTAKVRTKSGGEYTYSYADLSSVLEAIREPLSSEGLAIMQPCNSSGDRVTVTSVLTHESGEWICSTLVLPVEPKGDNPVVQAIGSAMTYGKRYGLSGLLAIASEADDDGAAVGEYQSRGRQTQQQNRPTQNRQAENRQPQQEQTQQDQPHQTAEDLNAKYNNPKQANAPAKKSEQAAAADPASKLKNTLFRQYSCKTKEDCDQLLRTVAATDEKGLDYFAAHPDECGCHTCMVADAREVVEDAARTVRDQQTADWEKHAFGPLDRRPA